MGSPKASRGCRQIVGITPGYLGCSCRRLWPGVPIALPPRRRLYNERQAMRLLTNSLHHPTPVRSRQALAHRRFLESDFASPLICAAAFLPSSLFSRDLSCAFRPNNLVSPICDPSVRCSSSLASTPVALRARTNKHCRGVDETDNYRERLGRGASHWPANDDR